MDRAIGFDLQVNIISDLGYFIFVIILMYIVFMFYLMFL